MSLPVDPAPSSAHVIQRRLNDLVAFIIQLYATQLMELKREGSASVTGFSYGFGRTQFIANLV